MTLATGAKNSAMPTPEISERADELDVGGGRRGDRGDPRARPIACSASPAPISRWPPMRSESAPAIGATSIGIAVQGRIRSPD